MNYLSTLKITNTKFMKGDQNLKNNQHCSELLEFIFHLYLLTLTQKETDSWHSTMGIKIFSDSTF